MLPDMFFSKEKELRQKIEQGEYPFLGLFSENFPIQTRVFIQKIIKGHDQSDHPVDRCIRGLVKYPALFSVYLVFHLMEGFGRNGHFEVYPLLAEAIGTSIPPNKTPNIWSAFRNACLSLGLSVSSRHSGSHFMVEEYLRQAGYPFNYIEQLTDKMIKFAADAGLPDDDDQNSIDLWRQGLLERLHPPFSVVARTAIEMDEGGYYVRLFCRLYNRQLDGSETELTRRISNALSSQAIVIRKISIPFVMFRNYQIGVLLPAAPGQERCWQIESGDFSTLYSSLDDERFISIPHNLPRAVMIKELHSSTKPWYYQLWEDDRDNRLVIFNLPSGRLVQTAKLSDGRINLKPGDYALLLRFTPDQDTDIEHISQIPALYLKSLTLLPSQTVIISRGPVHLAITADAAPIIRWLGEPVQAVRGEMIYPDAQLQIAISIPEEIIRATDKALNLYFSTHQLGDTIEIPLHFTNVTQQIVPVGDYLKKWQPGVTRLLAEVRRADSRRPLVRSAIMLWHGLLHVDRRVLFRCSALPRNIVEKECENIKIKADQNTITYRDEGNRFFKFIFMDGDRRLAFSWSVPGIFMSIEKPDSTGQLTETPVRIGSTVTSSQMTRDVLKIFASENAILKLGEWVLPVDFERLGGKRIPLAGLCNYTRIDNNSLEFLRGSGNESIRLLNIVSPHVVRSFLTEQGMRIHKAHFVAFDEVKAFRIRAHNLIDDDDFFIEISVDQINAEGDVRFPFGPKAKMFLSDNNQFTFYYDAEHWPVGIWFLEYQARLHNRWGHLSRKENEICSHAFIVSSSGMFGGWQEIKALIDEIRVEELINVFKRLIEIKGKISMGDDFCNDKNYYNEAWLYALKRIISVYPQDRWADIFDLPNDHRSTNFLGAYLSKFYGLPRENYIHLNGKQSVLLNCLRNLPPSSCLVEVFRNQDYDISSLFGFQNAAKASTCSEAPNKFDMLLFKKALIERDLEERWRLLRHDDWIPGPGDYLGPMHYRYALKNLEQRYLQTYTDPSVRIGKILPFVGNFALRNVHQYCQNSRIPKDDGVRHIGLFHWDIQTSNLSYEDSQKCDNLINIVSFLSLFAQVCRADARYPGVLARFSEDMKNYMDNDDDLYMKSFGYILFIGEDILGFYLMLWELIYAADCDAPRRQYVRN